MARGRAGFLRGSESGWCGSARATTLTETPTHRCSVTGVTTEAPTAVPGGVREHRRLADLPQLYVDCEIVMMRQLADLLGRPPAPATTCFYESTGQNGMLARSSARESISLPKPRESTAKSEDLREGELTPEPTDLQALLLAPADFAHNSGR
jgi:hypothetical protein